MIKKLKTAAAAVMQMIVSHKWISGICLTSILVALIVVLAVSCSRSSPSVSDSLLEADRWKKNASGFLYYDQEGYTNQFGIDISEWVEDINFKALHKSGIEFVILRVGYRGYETGKFVLDQNLASYLKDASAAGLKLGVYFVSQAVTTQEAEEEADYVLEHVKDYQLDLPVYLDLEEVYDTARTDGLSAREYTDIAKAFAERVEAAGYRSGVYANSEWFHNKLIFQEIASYDIWLAQYTETLSFDLPIDMWQFTNEGLVEGSDMWVDLNVRVSPYVPEQESKITE